MSGLDITLTRIREVETRINYIEQKFNRLLTNHSNSIKSFGNILDEKINKDKDDIDLKKISSLTKNTANNNINEIIEKYAQKNNLDKSLVNAVIQVESNFNNKAVSPAGAQGLMQLMPLTAQNLGVDNPFNPEENISGGTKYLKNLISRYDSVELGLAAYNAGPANVNKYGGIPPYDETRNYVKKVMELQKTL